MTELPPQASLKTRLLQETSRIAWRELQTYYARGQVVQVAPSLDLLDVACALAEDNVAAFKDWMASHQVGEVPAETAREWFTDDTVLWAVVIMPWVLVQHHREGRSTG